MARKKPEGGMAVETKAAHDAESIDEIKKLLGQIEKAEEAVEKAEIELNARKESAKIAKGAWLTAVGDLRKLVQSRKRWREEAKRQPLLNGKKKPEAEKLPEGATGTKHVGILKDVNHMSGRQAVAKGEEHTAFVDAAGGCFLLVAGSRIDLAPDEYAELIDKAESQQPLLDGSLNGKWCEWPVSVLGEYGLPPGKVKLLESAFDDRIGKLIDRMNRQGSEEHWWKDIKGFGESGYDAMVNALMELRKARPEFQAESAK